MHGAVVVLLSTLVYTAAGFPNGAPLEACTHMTPQHPALQGSDIVSSLTSYNPYTVTLGSTHYSDEEQEIEVILRGPTFFGFIIQAQCANHPKHIVGEFKFATGMGVQYLSCEGNGKGTVTHTVSYSSREDHHEADIHHGEHDLVSPHPTDAHHEEHHNGTSNADEAHHTEPVTGGPIQTLRLHWKPGTYEGDVIFKATVVQHQVVFWTGLKSPKLAFNDSKRTTPSILLNLAMCTSIMIRIYMWAY